MTEPVPWNYVFSQVKAAIPNAPDALIRQQVYRIMIDFTFGTNVWTENVPFTVTPGLYAYSLTLTSGRPARLLCVYDATGEPYPDQRAYSPDYSPSERRWVDSNIIMRPPGVIRLLRPPTEEKRWVAIISKQCGTPQMTVVVPPEVPAPTGYPEIDAWIVDAYADTIVYGTLAALQSMPAKPFRDPAAAGANNAYYNSGKSEVRVNHMHGNVFGGQTWMYPQGFAVTSRKGWT